MDIDSNYNNNVVFKKINTNQNLNFLIVINLL